MQAVLGGLKLSELKKRAQKVGVGVHELEEADDEPDTPKAVIALVLDSKCLILTVTPSILCALGAYLPCLLPHASGWALHRGVWHWRFGGCAVAPAAY